MTTRSERERSRGLERGEYEWLDEAGNGNCWICKQPETVPNRRLAIDHDHETGSIRGLLCTRCNQVLGRMHDDPELLRQAAKYIDDARTAFSDGCHQCMDAPEIPERWIYPPAVVVETDGAWTRYGYICEQGHRWTSGHRTGGVPYSWRM